MADDPIEKIIADALDAAEIPYARPAGGHGMDFTLLESGVKIECSAFWTARKIAQLQNHPDVIFIQGRGAALAFARMLGVVKPHLSDDVCHADRDGDCEWAGCPQTRDGEPEASGRHCPLDRRSDDD